jgi:hypothetical protein
MCSQCYATGAAVGEAAMLIGGPIAYAGYRRARRALGLRDTAVAPRAPESRPGRAHRPTLPAASGGTVPARTATG